jgi:hypothetical protein
MGAEVRCSSPGSSMGIAAATSPRPLLVISEDDLDRIEEALR